MNKNEEEEGMRTHTHIDNTREKSAIRRYTCMWCSNPDIRMSATAM